VTQQKVKLVMQMAAKRKPKIVNRTL
jgi:hypothetical protein